MIRMHDDPALTVEVGARVTYLLSEEHEMIQATQHYNTCKRGEDCGFCYYGPVPEFRPRPDPSLAKIEEHLGEVWFF